MKPNAKQSDHVRSAAPPALFCQASHRFFAGNKGRKVGDAVFLEPLNARCSRQHHSREIPGRAASTGVEVSELPHELPNPHRGSRYRAENTEIEVGTQKRRE